MAIIDQHTMNTEEDVKNRIAAIRADVENRHLADVVLSRGDVSAIFDLVDALFSDRDDLEWRLSLVPVDAIRVYLHFAVGMDDESQRSIDQADSAISEYLAFIDNDSD